MGNLLARELRWEVDGHTAFRTGDVGEWNVTGELEVYGRIDNQAPS